jgi:hypothetical protein
MANFVSLRHLSLRALLVLAAAPLVVACAEEEDAVVEGEDLEIAGLWTDNFDSFHDITTEQWSMSFAPFEEGGERSVSLFLFESFSNEDRVIIAQNDANNEFSPSLFSRLDWAWVGDDLYFCQTSFDSATAEAAAAVPAADATNVETGCGGFAWSSLTVRVDN